MNFNFTNSFSAGDGPVVESAAALLLGVALQTF
jgi:hypothetical protein